MSLPAIPVRSGCFAFLLSLVCGYPEVVPVPNGSFESPDITTLVGLSIDSWQKNSKPPGFIEDYPGEWDTIVGVYNNPEEGSSEHIDNMNGGQAIFVFAVPGAGLSIDYHSVDNFDDGPEAPHEFDTRFTPGNGYRLSVSLIGGGGGRGTPVMKEGVPLKLSLYYHDQQTNAIEVASTTVAHSLALFPSKYHFVDFHVDLPMVDENDPWAEKRIGIGINSIVSDELQGSYWDVDNVRLATVHAPSISATEVVDGNIKFTLESAPGIVFDVLAAPDPALPIAEWSAILTVTNETGSVSVTNQITGLQQYYQLRQQP